MLAYLPVDPAIKHHQQAYYDQLAAADAQGDCSSFIEFLLAMIEDSLNEAIDSGQDSTTLGKTPDRTLDLLREDSTLSIPELALQLDKSASAVERAIRKLRESGRLQRIGPSRGGRWQVLDESPHHPHKQPD